MIESFPPSVQKEIREKGLAGSPHGLASVELKESRFLMFGYVRCSMTKQNWSARSIRDALKHADSGSVDYFHKVCKYLSTARERE